MEPDSRPDAADAAIREDALRFVAALSEANGGLVTMADLHQYRFRGQQVFLATHARGIMKPKRLQAAISLRTPYETDPASARYADAITAQDGYPRYKYQDRGPDEWDNESVRIAMRHGLRLIWLLGLAKGLYAANIVFVVDDERDKSQFVLALDDVSREMWGPHVWAAPDAAARRAYALRLTKQRVHQPAFRRLVLDAYRSRCAICTLADTRLLDAAHIREDRDGGEPVVQNGIAMCAIHHRAFDAEVIGIRPDYVVQVQPRVLEVTDGPTLRHALQGVHGVTIQVPLATLSRPDTVLLEERFARFLKAG